VDAHREIVVEAFTCMLVFKNIFSFGLTFSGYDWLVSGGIKPVFMAIASVQVAICCSTVLLCESIHSHHYIPFDTVLTINPQTSSARRTAPSLQDTTF
jgi:hypothetical protein